MLQYALKQSLLALGETLILPGLLDSGAGPDTLVPGGNVLVGREIKVEASNRLEEVRLEPVADGKEISVGDGKVVADKVVVLGQAVINELELLLQASRVVVLVLTSITTVLGEPQDCSALVEVSGKEVKGLEKTVVLKSATLGSEGLAIAEVVDEVLRDDHTLGKTSAISEFDEGNGTSLGDGVEVTAILGLVSGEVDLDGVEVLLELEESDAGRDGASAGGVVQSDFLLVSRHGDDARGERKSAAKVNKHM